MSTITNTIKTTENKEKPVRLLPTTKKLKERIKQYGTLWVDVGNYKNRKILIRSLCKKDLRWVEPDDIMSIDKISCETCILKDDPTCENYLCD